MSHEHELVAAAAVIGARHQRAGRNGQDAAVVVDRRGRRGRGRLRWLLERRELGGRRATRRDAVRAKLRARLEVGERVRERSRCGRPRARRREPLRSRSAIGTSDDRSTRDARFTITCCSRSSRPRSRTKAPRCGHSATARTRSMAHVRVLGPFANNEPPYLAYDLLGDRRDGALRGAAHRRDADRHRDRWHRGSRARPRRVRRDPSSSHHPMRCAVALALLARGDERIDWGERRVIRTPAVAAGRSARSRSSRVA